MTAQYLVNLGIAQLYFDAELKRCAPPGTGNPGEKQTIYFVRMENDGTLLTKTWDIGLAEFTDAQRERADFYRKVES